MHSSPDTLTTVVQRNIDKLADFSFLVSGFGQGAPSSRQSQQAPPTTPPKTPKSTRPPPSLSSSMMNTLVKAKSASQLPKMALVGTPPSRGRGLLDSDSNYLNTLPDPRTPSPAPLVAADSQHPDLSNEVAMLSTKLINAINHQTNLDDSLQHTRHELEKAKRKIVELETKTLLHARQMRVGLLVKKADVDAQVNAMQEELFDAQKARDVSDRGRKEMEVELETLTSALFEEANTMVAAARKESEATERKNAQLRSQLNDTELLLASQQEQLADLKNVMEKMSSERDETDTLPHSSTAPSTPGPDTANNVSHIFDAFPLSPSAPNFGETPPDQPLRFSHLITPVMRNDLQAYGDFAELLKSSRAAVPSTSHSRASSGLAFGSSNASNGSAPLSTSSPSMPGSFSSGAAASPRDLSSSLSSSSSSYGSSLPALKDNKFYKRCLVEDIEPALRLDLAPGLSWLARRTVVGAITNGTLVVEPFIPQSKFFSNVYACSLCGESRPTEPHTRRHRFRTSEDDSAQRYPLCEYCLGRVRATCDFLGFLRMVRDGLWRARNDDDINGAWEESVRLREKMFWARLGGGVVPAVTTRYESPPSVQRRRLQGSLLRNDSSTSSIATRLSMDDGAPTSLDSHGLGLSVGVPQMQDPFTAKSQLRQAQTLSTTSGTDDAFDGVDTSDFAMARETQPDAPLTPTNDTHRQHVDTPSTPTSGTHQQIVAPSTPANGTYQSHVDAPATPTSGSHRQIAAPSTPTNGTHQQTDAPSTPTNGTFHQIDAPPDPADEIQQTGTASFSPTNDTRQDADADLDGPSAPESQIAAVLPQDVSLDSAEEHDNFETASLPPVKDDTSNAAPSSAIPGSFD